MKKLLKYLEKYKWITLLAPLFKLLEVLLELLVPRVVESLIDVGIAKQDQAFLASRFGLMIFLGVVGLSCSVVAQYFAAKSAAYFVRDIRVDLMKKILTFSYADLDRLGGSTMITRMTSDMNQIQQGMNLFLRLALRSPFVVLGAVIMAFTINAKLALIFVIVVPALLAVILGIMVWSIPRYRQVQGRLDTVLRLTRENLTGVRVIRAFGIEEDETKRFQKDNHLLTTLQEQVGRVTALMNPLTYVILNVAVILLIGRGAVSVQTGAITQGALVALYNYMAQILVELVKLANLILNLTRSFACGDRVSAILETEATQHFLQGDQAVRQTGRTEISVSFEDVSLRYLPDADEALSHLTFQAKRGSLIGIIGGTGSGKTSLVNLIPRFYDATGGTVFVNGVDVKKYDPDALRKLIGVVPQKAALISGSIRDNMKWGKADATDEEIEEALRIAQAMEVVDHKEGGLSYQVSQGGKNFSGGQKQRLTIARALVKKPEILILDDSSSALDYLTDRNLREAIRGLTHPPTTFIVSQRTASIEHCDQILVLDNGELVGRGTHEALLRECEVYREIYASQGRKQSASQEGQGDRLLKKGNHE